MSENPDNYTDIDPLSDMKIQTLQVIGHHKELKAIVEDLAERGHEHPIVRFGKLLDGLTDEETQFVIRCAMLVGASRTLPRRSFMTEVGRALDRYIYV